MHPTCREDQECVVCGLARCSQSCCSTRIRPVGPGTLCAPFDIPSPHCICRPWHTHASLSGFVTLGAPYQPHLFPPSITEFLRSIFLNNFCHFLTVYWPFFLNIFSILLFSSPSHSATPAVATASPPDTKILNIP